MASIQGYTDQDKAVIQRLTEKALKVLIEEAWPSFVCFDLPGINYEAHFQVKRVGGDWQFIVGIVEVGSDVFRSNWIMHSTRENLLQYLASEKARTSAYAAVLGLSATRE